MWFCFIAWGGRSGGCSFRLSLPLPNARRPGLVVGRCARLKNFLSRKEANGLELIFPRCRKCGEGDLVPLSDFGSQGASIEYKAWVCTNPGCLYNIKIRNGDIIINEPISDGSLHNYRSNR